MTKSQCYNEITRNNKLINLYKEQIKILNKEIDELTDTGNKVANMKSTLSSCKQTSAGKLSETTKVSKINSKIVNNFFNNMNDLFSGSDYSSVFNGLENGINTIEDEIKKRENQITTLNSQITSCQNTINQMYSTISRIEEEERAAAEKAAAEAAKKEEDKNKK